MAKLLKHLSQQSLSYGTSQIIGTFEEFRQEGKIKHKLHDVTMSGLAMMYFQDPSLLKFQESLKETEHRDNLETLFNVATIPKDGQMRNILDEVVSEAFRPVFKEFHHRLQRGKHLEQYQLFDKSYLIPIDATQNFSSSKHHCAWCLEKKHKDGSITYSHQILQGAIVHPDLRQVIPLMPEQISNLDGNIKQDCELNAAKRFIEDLRKDHPNLKITVGGDGLHSKQSNIELLREHRMNFVLVAKPDDHKIMMEAVGICIEAGEKQSLNIIDDKGLRHFYEWFNDIPLNGNDPTIHVNYFHYQMLVPDENGEEKIHFENSWVTDFIVTKENIRDLVKIGRARWKIENECFNTLKNQGYSIAHNYGHGAKNLSFNFFILTLIAFYMHQIAELTDELFQACRAKLRAKYALWEELRSAIKWFVFDSFEQLFTFILNPKKFISDLRIKNPI
jgi:hypothetical protein